MGGNALCRLLARIDADVTPPRMGSLLLEDAARPGDVLEFAANVKLAVTVRQMLQLVDCNDSWISRTRADTLGRILSISQ